MTTEFTPPSHARPAHHHTTPRLILRTARITDAPPFIAVSHDPLNSPFDGVVGATISADVQAEKLESQVGSTIRGENAFFVIVLKPDQHIPEGVEYLKIDDGYLIGMTGFNSFPREKWLEGRDEEVLVGDMGVLVDHHFSRKGYAIEAFEKVVEIGFYDLGVEVMFLETNTVNIPFRGMMAGLGLGIGVKGEVGKGPDQPFQEIDDFTIWKFGRGEWERFKEGMKAKGKWFLE
jgi:RimJ/RimL family protein N-acetyltransferase